MISAEITSAWGYVAASWAATALVVGAYAYSVVRKGRELSKRVPKGSQRWM